MGTRNGEKAHNTLTEPGNMYLCMYVLPNATTNQHKTNTATMSFAEFVEWLD